LDKPIECLGKDLHPMGMLTTLVSGLSLLYPEANPAYKGVYIYKT